VLGIQSVVLAPTVLRRWRRRAHAPVCLARARLDFEYSVVINLRPANITNYASHQTECDAGYRPNIPGSGATSCVGMKGITRTFST